MFRYKNCSVIHGIECELCGLLYVGETKGQLNKRINSRRFQINISTGSQPDSVANGVDTSNF